MANLNSVPLGYWTLKFIYVVIHLISLKTRGKRNTKAHFVYKMSETFILPSYFSLFFALFYWGYSWEKVDIYQTLSFYRYLWLYNPALKKAVKAMTALRKVTIIERLCSYHYSRYYTGHYAGFLQCRRHPAFFQSMPSALEYYHKIQLF